MVLNVHCKNRRKSGAFILTGAQADALDREKLWETHITVQEGDEVAGGSIIAEVPETKSIVHRVMLPPGVSNSDGGKPMEIIRSVMRS